MFTGLVQAVGQVFRVKPLGGAADGRRRLAIDTVNWHHGAARGDSVCVAGVCLTVAETPDGVDGLLTFDAVEETLAKTTLGALEAGDRVNLEPAMLASDRLGGHVVQGHVDGVGTVAAVTTDPEWRVTVTAPEPLAKYLVPKGSVCIDGVSLTIASLDVAGSSFDVALIPETLAKTTLSDLRPGDRVNLEMDVLAKTIVHYLDQHLEARLAGLRVT